MDLAGGLQARNFRYRFLENGGTAAKTVLVRLKNASVVAELKVAQFFEHEFANLQIEMWRFQWFSLEILKVFQ